MELDVRSKAVGDKYRESKKFVEEYERQYHKEVCTWTPLEYEIFDTRKELSVATSLVRKYPNAFKGKDERVRKRLFKLLKKKHGG